MRLSKKHHDTEHKKPQEIKKYKKPHYKLDEPIRSNAKEADWQLEERKLKERHRDQLR